MGDQADAQQRTQTALEARAAGVPVVAADWPAVARALDHGQAGLLVPPRDPVTLSKVTRTILDDPAVKARLLAAPPTPGIAEVTAFWSRIFRSRRPIAGLVK